MYFETVECYDDERRLKYAVSLLQGNAKNWFRSLHQRQEDPVSYTSFKAALKAQFAIINPVEHARERFKAVRQTHSVRAYNQEIRALMVEIPGLGTEELEFNYVAGLKPHIKKDIKISNVQGIDNLMAAADKIDNVTYGRDFQPRGIWNRRSHAPPSSAGSPMELGNLNVRQFRGNAPRPSGNSRWATSNSGNSSGGNNFPRLTPEER